MTKEGIRQRDLKKDNQKSVLYFDDIKVQHENPVIGNFGYSLLYLMVFNQISAFCLLASLNLPTGKDFIEYTSSIMNLILV